MHQSPEQLWPEQPHSSFCPCEAKMGRSHSSKGAVMAWDEMDGDSFSVTGGQFSAAAQKCRKKPIWLFELGTHELFRHSWLFHPSGFPCLEAPP